MTRINIQFARFSAYYSPLIMTIAGGYLRDEGLDPAHSVTPTGKSVIAALEDGSAHVVQSGSWQGMLSLEKGVKPTAVHFAQVNEKDGFFLAARAPDPDFAWGKLAGKRVLVDHGTQPLAMFKYACHKTGLDYKAIEAIDAGGPDEIEAAFRAGEGEYVHLQGPGPQQLEHDGVGHVIASVGQAIGPCAFSSLAALPAWLETDMAKAFMRAYRKARRAVIETPAAEVGRIERDFFPDIDPEVLTSTIATYQTLGNWTPHVEITEQTFEVTLDIFLHAGLITKRHPYAEVVAPPPQG